MNFFTIYCVDSRGRAQNMEAALICPRFLWVYYTPENLDISRHLLLNWNSISCAGFQIMEFLYLYQHLWFMLGALRALILEVPLTVRLEIQNRAGSCSWYWQVLIAAYPFFVWTRQLFRECRDAIVRAARTCHTHHFGVSAQHTQQLFKRTTNGWIWWKMLLAHIMNLFWLQSHVLLGNTFVA